MKYFRTHTLALLFIITTAIACSSNEEIEVTAPDIIPSNLIIAIDIVGQHTGQPNGNGTGQIKVTASATNASAYKIQFENNISIENTTGIAEHEYLNEGINSYIVTVFAYSETGNAISQFRKITVLKEDEAGPEETGLVWSDEFDTDGTPDSSKWVFEIGNGANGWGNNEKQYYTNRNDNAIVDNGILKIIAKRENYQGYNFTSTRMKTQGKYSFTYGEVKVRAKLPKGSGTWPAIWMLGDNITSAGWPLCGEIDIMEHVGNREGHISSAIHNQSGFAGGYYGDEQYKEDVTSEFHVYGIEWTPEKIIFKVDEVAHFTYHPDTYNDHTWPFYRNQFLLLNIAMGGNLGGTINSSFSESVMEIDYVRVYK
ncbi:glycoside hydrolase family 16 protein [Flavicella sediminum]|uniref:glycoside hydrolase family 16 protein n=1 Tax=Flavicella sediminum TaxID=2585141 RepID=UPI0011211773|nr:glycoside hydrolase family 16 protein [Flavicella sediminum]